VSHLDLELEGAPANSAFEQVMHEVWDGKCKGVKGIAGIGKQKKVRRMVYCLAEAKRARNREALRAAESISLHQDFSLQVSDDLNIHV
jgi:hypothetical protein